LATESVPKDMPMEARIARLEADVAHLREDVGDVKKDVRALREKLDALRDRMDAKFDTIRAEIASAKIWALLLYFALAAAMRGTMARGFGWI